MGERFYNAVQTTIPANGTITGIVDLMGYGVVGLIAETAFSVGTLYFDVAATAAGEFHQLRRDDGTLVATGALSGTFALGADGVLKHLAAYRYVRIRTDAAQASGVTFRLPLRY